MSKAPDAISRRLTLQRGGLLAGGLALGGAAFSGNAIAKEDEKEKKKKKKKILPKKDPDCDGLLRAAERLEEQAAELRQRHKECENRKGRRKKRRKKGKK